ncbi:uncharacterized protein CANTADRAFT_32620, partial [Suhomyces tanzawaensis NRRL Y-17324]
LKYDPTDLEGDFTSYNVLPFLQHRLNQHLLTNMPTGRTPSHNLRPTDDQRKLLAILQSQHSAILNGGVSTGKSLASAIYALNLTFSRVPKYGIIRKRSSVDSIILVPTDEMVAKYQMYFEMLTTDIPALCCPDELKLQKGGTGYTLTRRPLVIEYLFSEKPTETYSTDLQSSVPQILVTTLSGLEKVVRSEGPQQTKQKHLLDLQLLAVDDMSLFLKSTHIGQDCLIQKSGKKSKYVNSVQSLIKEIQNLHLSEYYKDLDRRLDITKKKFEEEKGLNNLGPSELEKRLTKHRRKFLYKPIQYCFISKSEESYKHLLQTKLNLDNTRSINMAIQKHNQVQPQGFDTTKIHDLYTKFLIEKSDQLTQRDEDPLTRFVEKLIRFNDTQRVLKERERKLISASSSISLDSQLSTTDSSNFSSKPSSNEVLMINAYFPIGLTGEKLELVLKDLNVSENFPSDSEIVNLMNHHVELSRHNVKNLEKSFLKFKTDLEKDMVDRSSIRKYIPPLIKKFKELNPTNDSKFLVVVPNYVNIRKIIKKLSGTCKGEKFRALSDTKVNQGIATQGETDQTETSHTEIAAGSSQHLILNASQSIGIDFSGYSNVIIFGLDSLIPQLAFVSKPSLSSSANKVSGIVDPFDDLSVYYLAKLLATPTKQEKNILFVFDSYSKRSSKQDKIKSEQSLKRFSEIIMYNQLVKKVNTKSLFEEDIPLVYGIDDSFVSSVQS